VSGRFPSKGDFESPSSPRAESRGNRGHTVIGPWPLKTVIWTAGVTGSPPGKWLNVGTDLAGRV
jgi:hypothetical protein